MKSGNIFYVLRRVVPGTCSYLGPKKVNTGPFEKTLALAQRFCTVEALLSFVTSPSSDLGAVRGYDGFQIVRVEETTTEGTKRRIEVPLGDPRQTGVAFKTGLEFANPQRWIDGGLMWGSLDSAAVFSDTASAIRATHLEQKSGTKSTSLLYANLVGIAEESTPGTPKYTETVLA